MLGGIFETNGLETEEAHLNEAVTKPDFWQNREQAERSIARLKRLKKRLDPWRNLRDEVNDLHELHILARTQHDESLEPEISAAFNKYTAQYERLRLLELLGAPHDSAPSFLTIHSGAGGTEACDWVTMLLRMYTRWCERRGFKTTILDLQEAEGGLKSVTMEVNGDYAHGYLKCETGIHRLVRISPFDSSGRRHTSFASVYASPVIEEDIDIDIRPESIRVDTYRASGAGGQHVNKTDSAVRITHLSTSIVVQCQNERSQHKNRASAMRVLQSRLYEHLRKEREVTMQKQAQTKKDIAWGHQIRSYVFQPYTMVKDHRTNMEMGNIQAVMDGHIDGYIDSYLRLAWKTQPKKDG